VKLGAGDWVEVRSKTEILMSLDEKGRFQGLPFMPQMFQYCGQRFRVYKRAHKTCDTVNQTGGAGSRAESICRSDATEWRMKAVKRPACSSGKRFGSNR
jgi:hypothetical protein